MNNDQDPSQSRKRLSREELESYRNDSRYNNLLMPDAGKKKKKDTMPSFKVGGIRLTPKRIMILCGFFIVVSVLRRNRKD